MAIDNTEQEGIKLLFETFKHLTTLSTGSIVLLSTFFKDSFSNPQWGWLTSLTFTLFMISTVTSVMVMVAYSEMLRSNKSHGNYINFMGGYGIIISELSFILAVIALSVFGIKSIGLHI